MPSRPAFCGHTMYVQAAFIDPGAAGYFGLTVTKGVSLTFRS